MSITSAQPLRVGVEFTILPCCECGCLFGLPNVYIESRREDGEVFYCPNGHSQGYPDPDEKESPEVRDLKQQLAQAMHNADQAQAKIAELQEQQHQPSAQKPEKSSRKSAKASTPIEKDQK